MAITSGRFQTHQNKNSVLPWSVIDTTGKTLGERHMCACRNEIKATVIASALNFNERPEDYDYYFRPYQDV